MHIIFKKIALKLPFLRTKWLSGANIYMKVTIDLIGRDQKRHATTAPHVGQFGTKYNIDKSLKGFIYDMQV
jgi:hypothetical protein